MFITKAMAAGAETAHGAAEGAHGGVFPPFDPSTFASQLFWLAITFGFFYWFVSKVISPKIGEILETRSDRIATDLDKVRELQAEADAAHAAYEQDLAEARRSAAEIAHKARDKAKAEADAERARVEAELAGRLGEAETRIAAIRAKAMGEVGDIAAGTTAAILERLVGGKATAAEIAGAIESTGR